MIIFSQQSAKAHRELVNPRYTEGAWLCKSLKVTTYSLKSIRKPMQRGLTAAFWTNWLRCRDDLNLSNSYFSLKESILNLYESQLKPDECHLPPRQERDYRPKAFPRPHPSSRFLSLWRDTREKCLQRWPSITAVVQRDDQDRSDSHCATLTSDKSCICVPVCVCVCLWYYSCCGDKKHVPINCNIFKVRTWFKVMVRLGWG